MKISIITVTFNSGLTIKDTIESILRQTFENFEHIIIDGKSTDNTLRVIDDYYYNKLVVSEEDLGIYHAMNKGIQLATGDIIGFLNSDDIFENENVLSIINQKFQHDFIDGLYGNLFYVNKYDTNLIVRKWTSLKYFNNFFERGNVPPHPCLYLKKNVYKEIGNFNLDLKLAADYEFMLRLFKSNLYKIEYVPLQLIRMRVGGATNKSFLNIYKGNIEILKSWKLNNLSVPFFLMPLRVIKRFKQYL